MKLVSLIFLSIVAIPAASANDIAPTSFPIDAYLDLEEGETASVFTEPGHNWKSCAASSRCQAVGWPDNKSRIKLTGPKRIVPTPDIYTGEAKREEYYPIEFSYERIGRDGRRYMQSGKGWIDAASIRLKKVAPVYSTAAPERSGGLECSPDAGTDDAKFGAERGSKLTAPLQNLAILSTADAIHASVGMCVTKNPSDLARLSNTGNHYDNRVLPEMRRARVPAAVREDGKRMTREDLIAIDALARTLYSELGSCFKHGLQYPMAVAKVAVNRANATARHAEFIKPPHANGKSPLAKVVTSASQFNVWFGQHDGKQNGPLRQALCPPRDAKETFWAGFKPPKMELDIWRNAVRISTEAVLFPNKFNRRTSGVSGMHYTAGLSSFYRMRIVSTSIEGRPISRQSCVQLWVP